MTEDERKAAEYLGAKRLETGQFVFSDQDQYFVTDSNQLGILGTWLSVPKGQRRNITGEADSDDRAVFTQWIAGNCAVNEIN